MKNSEPLAFYLVCLKYEQKMLQRWGPLFMFSDTVFFAQPMVPLSKLCWDCQLEDMKMRQWLGELGNSSTIGRFAPKPKSALWAALKLFSVCRPPPFFLDTSIWGPQEIWEVGRLPAERAPETLAVSLFFGGFWTSVLRQTSKQVIAIFGGKKRWSEGSCELPRRFFGFLFIRSFFFRASKGIFCHGNESSAKIRHTQRWGFNRKAYAPPALYLSANYHHRVSSCLVVVRELVDSDRSIEVQWLVPRTKFENILVQSFFSFAMIFTRNLKHPFIHGCFNWMMNQILHRKWLEITKHPF